MTVKQIKASLWLATTAITGVTIWVVMWGAHAIQTASVVNTPEPTILKSGTILSAGLPALGELETVCQRDLRQPLYDPPPSAPPSPPPPPPPPSPPTFKLAGTVIEPGRCQALFLTIDGKLEFKRVDDLEDGAQVVEIHHDSVLLKFNGQDLVMNVEKKTVFGQ